MFGYPFLQEIIQKAITKAKCYVWPVLEICSLIFIFEMKW